VHCPDRTLAFELELVQMRRRKENCENDMILSSYHSNRPQNYEVQIGWPSARVVRRNYTPFNLPFQFVIGVSIEDVVRDGESHLPADHFHRHRTQLMSLWSVELWLHFTPTGYLESETQRFESSSTLHLIPMVKFGFTLRSDFTWIT